MTAPGVLIFYRLLKDAYELDLSDTAYIHKNGHLYERHSK